MKNSIYISVAGVLVLITIGVWALQGIRRGETIVIGAALGLSDVCAQWGTDELKAAQLATDEANAMGGINGKPIRLVAEDMRCDPKGAVNAMKKLVDIDHVEGVVGFTWGDSFQAGYTVNTAAHVVAVSPSTIMEALAINETPIDYVFSTYPPLTNGMELVAGYAERHNAQTFVVVRDLDPYSVVAAETFKQRMSTHQLELVEEYDMPIGTDDFRTIVAKLKSQNPDGVFIAFQQESGQAEFLTQAHELGLKTLMISAPNIDNESLLKDYGVGMEGVVFAVPKVTSNAKTFVDKYKARYGASPQGPTPANAYDATRMLIAGLQEHYRTRDDLKVAMAHVKLSGTVSANVAFDQMHQLSGFEYEIKTVKNGQFTVVQ
jgi:branched-chain amino acid transport system substrate-binding protein